MAQDIRELFKNDDPRENEKLPKGHQKRFEARLEEAFPQEKKGFSYFYLKIAAVLVVALGIGFYFLQQNSTFTQGPAVVDSPSEEEKSGDENQIPQREFRLSEVSPEFKKVENYYMASLNMELAKIEVNDENRELINSFMEQMADLDDEYQRLNNEISENGITDQSLEAMIANLQLRLELLYKLKNKLKDINQSKNDNYENYQV